jgi:hypothetical protein
LDPVLEFVILAFLKMLGIIAPPVSAFSKNSKSENLWFWVFKLLKEMMVL